MVCVKPPMDPTQHAQRPETGAGGEEPADVFLNKTAADFRRLLLRLYGGPSYATKFSVTAWAFSTQFFH